MKKMFLCSIFAVIACLVVLLLIVSQAMAICSGTQITTNSTNHYWPAISGEIIVWQDYRNGYPYVYM